nr:Chain CCC, Non structured protein 3 from Eastern Equine Encephalitis Virus [Eastern equine encephalitis virus]7BN2_DDD Chain DDD, Non structured protein 3 from Eastern Equine Encephalitis Virus [Eastern equine encephalitis virus]
SDHSVDLITFDSVTDIY